MGNRKGFERDCVDTSNLAFLNLPCLYKGTDYYGIFRTVRADNWYIIAECFTKTFVFSFAVT